MAFTISKQFKVGILITGAIVALIWGINYLKGIDLFSNTNTYFVVYPKVNGLAKSNVIKMNGLKVGQVQKITFLEDNSGKIVVAMRIKNDVFVSKDSRAEIASADLLGTKEIEIILGTSNEPAPDNDTLQGSVQIGLTESLGNQVGPVKDKVESLVLSLDTLSRNLNGVLNDQNKIHLNNSFSSLETTMKNLERVSNSLDKISQPGGSLNASLNNVQSISGTVNDKKKQIGDLIDNIDALSDSLQKSNLKGAIESLNQNLAELKQVLDKINSGQGSLGKLINDDQLYQHLDSAVVNLDKLLIDLKANPKRYVSVSVFGKKDKAPK